MYYIRYSILFYFRFQDQIEDIKRKICDLVEKAFSFVTTVEDGLDILRIVYQYYKWTPVKYFLRDKIIKVNIRSKIGSRTYFSELL